MFQKIKKILCLHQFEYEMNEHSIMTKECRKCGVSH